MVNQTLALQVRPPEVDISTPLLRASQIRAAESQNALSGLQLESARERKNALQQYSATGDETALRGQPDIQAQVFQNLDSDRKRKIEMIGASARALYPLRGKPEFKEAWQQEVDSLYESGAIPEQTYKQWRDNPSDLVLDQAMAMSHGLDTYLKAKGVETSQAVTSAVSKVLGGEESGASVDPYATNLLTAESGGRNVQTGLTKPDGRKASSAFGPFQFTEGTFRDVVSRHSDLGLKPGEWKNPQAQVKAERRFRMDNAIALADAEIPPVDRNLYMAHWLGASGATRFLKGMQENPDAPAHELMSKEAVENHRDLLFSPGGKPISAQDVYEKQTGRFGDGMTGVQNLAPPQQRAGTGGSFNDRLAAAAPILTQLAMTPGLGEGQRKTILELAKSGIAAGQPTGSEKDYQEYAKEQRAQGKTPLGRLEWKRAGASSVSVSVGGEKKFSEKLNELDAQRVDESMKSSDAARSQLSEIDRITAALDSGKFEPGAFGHGRQFISQIAELVGVDTSGLLALKLGDPKAADTLDAASNALAVEIAKDLSRATNMSLGFIRDSLPSLTRTSEGNRIIAETLRRSADRRIQHARMLDDFLKEHPNGLRPEGEDSFYRIRDNYDRENPVIDEALKSRIMEASKVAPKSWRETLGLGKPGANYPAPAVTRLRTNPDAAIEHNGGSRTAREWFDLEYGEGAAARALGN